MSRALRRAKSKRNRPITPKTFHDEEKEKPIDIFHDYKHRWRNGAETYQSRFNMFSITFFFVFPWA